MLTEYKYTCPNCDSHDNLKLLLARKGEYKNQYFYTCRDGYCKFYLNTNLNTNHEFDNFQNWNCDSYSFGEKIDCEDCINVLKINMLDILSEFIECTWAGHYTTVFDYIIKPHLDNLDILKFFLKSTETITDTFHNANGYKMYDDLYRVLLDIDNIEIHEFVSFEFIAK